MLNTNFSKRSDRIGQGIRIGSFNRAYVSRMKLAGLFSCAVLCSSCSSFFQLVNVSPAGRVKEITFSDDAPDKRYRFYYSDTLDNAYLRTLKSRYPLESLVSGETTDMGKIVNILDWTSRQWEHSGSNQPAKQDALTILNEAQEGKQFRCVEYGIVATAALNSVGIPARTLGLKTRDVEKVMRGAGHIVSEVYSKDLGKWLFIDPQFNVIPTLNGVPLNGVEFQQAISRKDVHLKLIRKQGELSKEEAGRYVKWIGKYLFYFDVLFDQKTLDASQFKTINGMTKLTLVPVGVKEPRVFQRHYKIDYSHYTHSLNDFYRKPE